MGNKYCKKLHPLIAKSIGTSQALKSMVRIKDEVEPFIWWQLKSENSSFWFDKWIRFGALYYTETDSTKEEEVEVKEFVNTGVWDISTMNGKITSEM